jgi:glutaredoxin
MELLHFKKDIPFMSYGKLTTAISLLTFLLSVFYLERKGLTEGKDFDYFDVTADASAYADWEKHGVRSMPTVVTSTGVWGGFHIDKLNGAINALAQA